MSTADLSKTNRRTPGRLAVNPTNLGIPFPHGGTELGQVADVRWRWGFVYDEIVDEAWGERVERSHVLSVPFFAFVLGQRDDDAITRAFPVVTTFGGVDARIDGMGKSPGIVSAIDKVIFSPTDTAKGMGIYIRRPILHVEESAETTWSLQALNLIALIMEPTRDTAYGTTPPWQVGLLNRITL